MLHVSGVSERRGDGGVEEAFAHEFDPIENLHPTCVFLRRFFRSNIVYLHRIWSNQNQLNPTFDPLMIWNERKPSEPGCGGCSPQRSGKL